MSEFYLYNLVLDQPVDGDLTIKIIRHDKPAPLLRPEEKAYAAHTLSGGKHFYVDNLRHSRIVEVISDYISLEGN